MTGTERKEETNGFAEKKKVFSRESETFRTACRFVLDKTALDDDVAQVFITFKGEPFQAVFYDTVIYNMNGIDKDSVITAAAELYHLQRELNRKIGRTCYEKNAADEYLLRRIRDEVARRWEMDAGELLKTIYEDDANNLESFVEDVMAAYREKHVVRTSKHEYTKPSELIESFYKRNRDYLAQLNKGITDDVFRGRSVVCNMNSYTTLTKITRRAAFEKESPRSKDELYILCLVLGCNYTEFIKLREAIQMEKKDSSFMADNTLSGRDEKIQSILRDIDRVYDMAWEQHENISVENLPKLVLDGVNKMLKDNGFDKLCIKKGR